ncbi:MAG: polysaccharide biosynthesis C-terminal domain-containing protein [Bacteroidia bacterium]|nr:polysaccharide biosynthesis C-terminal domain-containing protein [Bacteroidia bacterium]
MGVIKRQGIINTGLSYIGILIGFINVIFIQPHFLDPEELGLIRVLYSFSAIVAMFLPLGIGNITIRYFPYFRDPENKHNGALGLNLTVAGLGFLLFGTILVLCRETIKEQYTDNSPLFSDYFYATLPLSFFVAINALLSIYCQSIFKSSFPVFLNDVAIRLLTILWVSLYYLKLFSLDIFIIGFIVQYFLQAIALLIYIHIVDTPGYSFKIAFIKTLNIKAVVKYGLLLAITSFASLGIKFIDMVILGHYVTLAKVSIYSVAVFIPTIIEAPLLALEKISNAKVADEWSKQNLKEISKIYSESTRYLTILGGLLFLGIVLNIDSLFKLLPHEFGEGKTVVLIVSLSTLFNMVTGLNGSILFSSKSYRYGSYMLFILLILSICNCLILIPLLGINGAALGIAIASLIYNLLKYFFILKKYKMQPFTNKTAQIIIVLLCAGSFVYFIPHIENAFADIALRTVLITILYGSGIYLIKVAPEFHKYLPWHKQKK